VSGVNVSLEIGGRAIQTRQVNVAPRASASVSFDPVTVAERNVRGSVRLPPDALVRDNVFHFVVSPEEPVRVIIADRAGAPRDTSLYLVRALAVSETPHIEVTSRQADSLADELTRAAVVILNDAPVGGRQPIGSGGSSSAAAGCSLRSASGHRRRPGILPGIPGEKVDRSRGAAARLGALEYGHPLFEVFRGPRTGDFAAARFYSYRNIAPVKGVQTLARFDDGQPALVERKVGNGRVLLWTSTLDMAWTDLAIKPVFVPFVHRVVRHLASYHEPKPWRVVGDVVDPALQTSAQGADITRVALTPSGERIRSTATLPRSGTLRARLLRVPRPGPRNRHARGRRQQRGSVGIGSDADRSAGSGGAAMGRAGTGDGLQCAAIR
jgi:hypothetical protein